MKLEDLNVQFAMKKVFEASEAVKTYVCPKKTSCRDCPLYWFNGLYSSCVKQQLEAMANDFYKPTKTEGNEHHEKNH